MCMKGANELRPKVTVCFKYTFPASRKVAESSVLREEPQMSPGFTGRLSPEEVRKGADESAEAGRQGDLGRLGSPTARPVPPGEPRGAEQVASKRPARSAAAAKGRGRRVRASRAARARRNKAANAARSAESASDAAPACTCWAAIGEAGRRPSAGRSAPRPQAPPARTAALAERHCGCGEAPVCRAPLLLGGGGGRAPCCVRVVVLAIGHVLGVPSSRVRREERARPRAPVRHRDSSAAGGGGGRPRGVRRHEDGAVRGLRPANPGQVPAQCAGPIVAHQVRAVLRLPLQPHRQVLLQGRQALLSE